MVLRMRWSLVQTLWRSACDVELPQIYALARTGQRTLIGPKGRSSGLVAAAGRCLTNGQEGNSNNSHCPF
ncbi:hypothetical protein RRG08_035361 [Elysia crispata]|uniref:Uncharacterized protein n=1 Tax=Elysia crispata TaxID=231223 RepID=A0AAE1CSH8_9GAST|nr:hypothetical protein RRG08_035361 [Elysia crispata]